MLRGRYLFVSIKGILQALELRNKTSKHSAEQPDLLSVTGMCPINRLPVSPCDLS